MFANADVTSVRHRPLEIWRHRNQWIFQPVLFDSDLVFTATLTASLQTSLLSSPHLEMGTYFHLCPILNLAVTRLYFNDA
jgi:hypothetical protein